MAFQVSPGVSVSEIDATNALAPSSSSNAGFAAAFLWGPAEKIVAITSEQDLANQFGKPTHADVEQNWHVASSFLAYGGSLNVVRTLGTGALNATDGLASTNEGVVVDLESTTPTPSGAWQTGQTHTAATQTGATNPAGGTGLQVTIVTDGSGNPTFTVTAGGTGYNSGDLVTFTDPGSSSETAVVEVETVTGTSAVGVLVKNEEAFDAGITALGEATFAARYAGALGNSIQIGVFHSSSGTLADWKEDFFKNGSTTTVNFGDLFDRLPDTSDYVKNNNGNTDVNDEIHVVVVDYDGQISGKAGEVLETYAHLSLATDAKDDQGNSNYFKDVIRRDSKYIYATGNWNSIGKGEDDGAAVKWEGFTSTNTTVFSALAKQEAISIKLADGEDVNGNGSGGGNHFNSRYTATAGYGLFRDKDAIDIDLLPVGVDTNVADLAKLVIDNVSKYRKDAITFFSPDTSDVIGASLSSSDKATAVAGYSTGTTGLNSTSYAVMDSGWKRVYNRYTDKYIDIPLNGDIAGLCVATEQATGAWWSPAGLNRGAIRNIVKLHFDPNKTERDTLYKANVNPVANIAGAGTILYGDKTFLKKPSAFDRINVRRLFNSLERTISNAAKYMLFEFNDEFTRASFRNMVEPFLDGIKQKRGIYDFKVICDSSNNTADVIDRNEFVGDFFIKPARSINYIQLNFIAVRTGVSFSEVAG